MKTFLKIGAVALVMLLPGLAMATHIEVCSGTADCTGWSYSMEIVWRTGITEGELDYSIVLTDEAGTEVERVDWAGPILSGGRIDTQTFDGLWSGELCGTYTATMSFHIVAPTGAGDQTEETSCDVVATFTCDCPTDACNYTPGYWKNHPENWPVTELSLGGTTYTQAQLLAILGTPVRGDATIILAYHLIAAKLNVLNGSDPSIQSAIDEADDLLAMYPLRSKPSGDAKDMIIDVKNMLVGYNELGCGDEDMGDSLDKALPGEESSTWGQLKANYR